MTDQLHSQSHSPHIHPPHIAQNVYQNLGSKTFWFLFSRKSITGFVFLILALIISVAGSGMARTAETASLLRSASWVAFVIAVISFIVAVIATRMIYKNTGFVLTPNALLLKRGVFKKEQFAIPYRQIQNIEIERSLADQILGVSKMIILTAGEENETEKKDAPENVLPIIDKDVAVSLQNELLKHNHG